MKAERQHREVKSHTIQPRKQAKSTPTEAYMVDNRDTAQMRLMDMIQRVGIQDEEPLQGKFDSIQPKKNNTGLPDNLKSGVESMSGFSMDDVRVHYNSAKPTQVQGINVNDDTALEREADLMGNDVIQMYRPQGRTQGLFLAQEKRHDDVIADDTFLSEDRSKANLIVRNECDLRVADTGCIAIEDGNGSREAKMFYGTEEIRSSSNVTLKAINSPIRLGINNSILISIINPLDHQSILSLPAIYPIDVRTNKSGDQVTIPQNCNEAGPYILNTDSDTFIKPKLNLTGWANNLNGESTNTVLYKILNHFYLTKNFEAMKLYFNTRYLLLKDEVETLRANPPSMLSSFAKYISCSPSHNDEIRERQDQMRTIQDDITEYQNRMNDPSIDIYRDIIAIYFNDETFIDGYVDMVKAQDPSIINAGINEGAIPMVGEMLSIRSVSSPNDQLNPLAVRNRITDTSIANPFPYHYASVIAKSGNDYITMENYARREDGVDIPQNEDPRAFFQMYGPNEQSFHAELKRDYPSPMTFVYGQQPEHRSPPESEVDSSQLERMQDEYNDKMTRM